jgi:hypothetical protein
MRFVRSIKAVSKRSTRWLSELGRLLKWCCQDLHEGARFWVAVIAGTIPAVLAALAISAHSSRLAVAIQVDAPGYQQWDSEEPDETWMNGLEMVIQEKLGQEVSDAGPAKTAVDSGEKEEKNGRFDSPIVTFVVKLEVTNIGAAPSTLKVFATYLVDEVDGHRKRIDSRLEFPENIALGEGHPMNVGGPEGYDVEFLSAGTRFRDYETVRIIQKNVATKHPKERPSTLAEPYLRLLTADDPTRQERLLKINDPSHQARLLLGVEAMDIYGRVADQEVVVLDSTDWTGWERIMRDYGL